MELGTKISFGAHGALIGLAVFGGPLFDADESKAIQISEVSIISAEAFDGMMSSAPNPNIEEPQQYELAQPDPVVDVPVVTEPVEQPTQEPVEPEVQEVVELEPVPELETEPAEPVVVDAPEAVVEQEATGNEVVAPDAQVSDQDQSGQVDPDQLALLRPKPRPAPRISNEVVAKPETDAERSEVETQKAEPSEEPAEETTDETVEAAKPESTTEIVTEADEVDPNSAAPIKSARPKGRPSDIVQRAQARKEAAEKTKKRELAAAKAKADKAAREELEAALKADAEASKPSGPPLTGREKGALVLAVQQCWTPPIGVQNAGDLKVTLLVELNEQGKITGGPTLVSPAGDPQGVVKQAFEAGRRALLRCGPYKLPADKYEQWKQIEVTFNPQNMVVR